MSTTGIEPLTSTVSRYVGLSVLLNRLHALHMDRRAYSRFAEVQAQKAIAGKIT
jgi:hypothetical protein